MSKNVIKISELAEELECMDSEFDYYYNPRTNEFFDSNIWEYSEQSEEEIEDMIEESIRLPEKYEMREYDMMEAFIDEIEDEKTRDAFYVMIQGKGAFGRFKEYCHVTGLIDKWYKFKLERYKEKAIEWCKDNDLEYEE